MTIKKFLHILLCLTALFVRNVVTNTSSTGPKEYQKLCLKYEQLVKSGVSEERMEKLLENEMGSVMADILGEKNLDSQITGREGNSWYFNSANSDVVVQSKDKIGEYGQLVRYVNAGTGQSTGSYDSAITVNQENHHIVQSDIKQILATIEAAISAKKKQSTKSHDFNTSSKSWVERVRKFCLEGMKAAYKRLQRKMQMKKNVSSNVSKKVPEKISESLSRGDENFGEEGGNSTLIDTQANIGPNGYSTNVINIATGQASNTGRVYLLDLQSHGKYQDSSVDLLKLLQSTPLTVSKKELNPIN